MKKYFLLIVSIFLILSLFAGCTKEEKKSSGSVNIYAYDSFCGKYGPGQAIAAGFTEKTGITVNYINCSDGVQALSKAIADKDNPLADIVLGFDNSLASRAVNSGIFESYLPEKAADLIDASLIKAIPKNALQVSSESPTESEEIFMTPFDYGFFTIIYDTQSNIAKPESIKDLTKDIYRKKLIIMDPLTSTPGLGFVTWVSSVLDSTSYADYFKALKANVLTLAPSWSTGYGMFTNGEAPLVISYTTSAAYHVEYESSNRYQALIFDEGHVSQIEYAGLLKNAANKDNAKKFLDYLISDDEEIGIEKKGKKHLERLLIRV